MNFFRAFIERAARAEARLDRFPFPGSVRGGLALTIPFLLVGSFALIVMSFPLPAYQHFMAGAFGGSWTAPLRTVYQASFGVLALIMSLTVGYSYAGDLDRGRNLCSPMIAAVVSLCSFLALSGIGSDRFSLETLGATGLFTALIAAALSTKIFVSLCSVRRLQIRTYADGAHTSFNEATAALLPALITITLSVIAHEAVARLFGSASVQQFASARFTSLFTSLGSSPASALLFILLIHLFWAVGVHGNNILEPVAQALFVPALAVNQQLAAAGSAPTEVFTKTFFDTFVFMGGCGSALCLLLAIFITARRKNLRRHAKISLLPVLFNVNELVVFGLPVIFNPVYIVPFIITPFVLTLTAWAATAAGIVPHTIHMSEWTTPVFLGGWTATGSAAGALLQLFNLALGTLIFIPFIRLAEKKAYTRTRESISSISAALDDAQLSAPPILLSRKDMVGNISRSLAVDLAADLRKGKLHLVYQPQVSYGGKLHGVEALLRWEHPVCGQISPPIAIALAEEAHFEEELAAWILDRSFRDLTALRSEISSDTTLSVNVSPRQLDGGIFLKNLTAAMNAHAVRPELIKIEITEKDALSGTQQTLRQMREIRKLGLKLAMDDFGMGHSSLMYLKEYEFDTVKIDGALVKELLTNPTCGGIISSVVNLGHSLNFSVIAEYVETQAQRDTLHELGCDIYQGYFYSKPMRIEELCVYARILRA